MSQTGVRVVAAVFYRHSDKAKISEVLIFRRGPAETGAGAWEFPGGKVDQGETDEEALRREIHEELGIAIRVGKKIGESTHQYPTKKVHLVVYFVQAQIENVSFRLVDHDSFLWVGKDSIRDYALALADIPLVDPIFKALDGVSKKLA